MPKITLLMGRKTMRVYDLDQAAIRIGREEDMDVLIDNQSVSRRQAEIRREGEGWVVPRREAGGLNFRLSACAYTGPLPDVGRSLTPGCAHVRSSRSPQRSPRRPVRHRA